ncbi:hypothetical protein BC835DRAFT_1310265 [Cytidiella melzeri]|nr:hypothetical protein BC835DRAFT_1310265 [Cytidiella melzeri]
MHINRNIPPGHNCVPEAVKVNMYITPHIMQEIPNGDIIVAQLTQTFVESIALPSIERWEQAMENNGISLKYSFLNRTEVPRYNYENPPSLVLSPSPYTSSLYSICGRPGCALDDAVKFHCPFYVASQPTAKYEAMKIARDQAQDDCNKIQAMLLQAQARAVKLETQLAGKERVLAASKKRLIQATGCLYTSAASFDFKRATPSVPSSHEQAAPSLPSSPHTSKQEDPGRFYFDSEPLLPPRYVPLTSSPLHASDNSDLIVLFGPACDAAIERYGLEPRLNVELWMYYNELRPENWYEHLCIHSRLELYEALAMTIAMHADRGIDFNKDRCTTPSVFEDTPLASAWIIPPPWTALELSDALPDSALFAGPNSLCPISSEPSLLPACGYFDVHPFLEPGGFNLLLNHPAPLFDETMSTQFALEDALLPNSSTHQEHSSKHAPAVFHNGELKPGTSSGVHNMHNVVPNTDSNARNAHASVREPPCNSSTRADAQHVSGLAFDDCIPLSVVQRNYMDEYCSLPEQEKDEYVRESLTDIVVKLTGNPYIKMNYVNFKEQIVQ